MFLERGKEEKAVTGKACIENVAAVQHLEEYATRKWHFGF